MDFIIDTVGDLKDDTAQNNSVTKQLLEEYKESLKNEKERPNASEKRPHGVEDEFNLFSKDVKLSKFSSKKEKQTYLRKKQLEDVLKKSVITPDFESLHSVPPYEVSKKRLRKLRQKERQKTKGEKWYGLPATEVTEEIKHDLEVLQMRSALDPKHFYKKNDLKVLPKYFQIGKVLDSPLDHYNNRIPKKQRKRTLVDELLADAEFSKYNKRKYKEIIEEKQKTDYKAWRKAKKLKKKGKQ
ncbi:deoxynucleotidyltransferase terminal-interacting protein 2 [Agrilus planipennis]|uniref:Deoxynucleotidyltransferase terminal-interacting protein 2 n=1 Tax=Agrilus planipennis TaxID=224129 RepID=A0A1W4WXI6_AGRPL|nr:deoxynucleotidyltransferase terminal-interacting protein 2 [Agrilus planipennis]